MKLLFFAGEASGDQHASKVIEQLKLSSPETEIVCWGGDLMQKAGAKLLSHYKHRAYMGLVEVIKHLKTIRGFMEKAKSDMLTEKPDAVVFIDNPGFNLPLAKFAKKHNIPVHWYIAPKAWAWNKSRVKTMRKCIDHLYVIFPFEVEFFTKLNMPCTYVGNPTFESVESYLKNHKNENTSNRPKKTIALLAGSRKNEVRSLLPHFIRAANSLENVDVRIAGAPGLEMNFYQSILKEHSLQASIEFNKTFEILNQSRISGGFALVASGTATLETGLFKVPQIVAYQVNSLTYFVGKQVLKIPFVSLVNILLNKPFLEEHLQNVSESVLIKAIERLILRTDFDLGYQTLWNQLSSPENGEPLTPSKTVANLILRNS